MSGVKRESQEPMLIEQLLAVLRRGPLTRAQLLVRLRNDSTPLGVAKVIDRARQRGLIQRVPDEGWALVAHAECEHV